MGLSRLVTDITYCSKYDSIIAWEATATAAAFVFAAGSCWFLFVCLLLCATACWGSCPHLVCFPYGAHLDIAYVTNALAVFFCGAISPADKPLGTKLRELGAS